MSKNVRSFLVLNSGYIVASILTTFSEVPLFNKKSALFYWPLYGKKPEACQFSGSSSRWVEFHVKSVQRDHQEIVDSAVQIFA